MNLENSMTGVVCGGGCVVPDDLFMLLKLSEKDTTAQEEGAVVAISEYAGETRSSLTVLGEENRKRGDEITALKSELCRLNMIHQQELQAAREEASFLKGRVTTLEQEMAESAEKVDVQMRTLVEENKVAVEAAIKSGEAKTLAAVQEADTLRREVETLQTEADRQKKLAEAERIAAVEAVTKQCEASVQAMTEQCKAEIEALKQKVQREKDEMNQKNQADIAAAVKAAQPSRILDGGPLDERRRLIR